MRGLFVAAVFLSLAVVLAFAVTGQDAAVRLSFASPLARSAIIGGGIIGSPPNNSIFDAREMLGRHMDLSRAAKEQIEAVLDRKMGFICRQDDQSMPQY